MAAEFDFLTPAGLATESEVPSHVDRFALEFQRLKVSIHSQLVESLDLSVLDKIDRQQLGRHVASLAHQICGKRQELISRLDMGRLEEELHAELFGLGPLETLLGDDTINDILVNGPYTVYVERAGRLQLTNTIFADDDHLLRIIRRVVGRLGRRIDESHPMVDARLSSGARVNAVIPPLVLGGPTLSIRRFSVKNLRIDDLVRNVTMTRAMADFLAAAVRAKVSCVISGGTGSGKTTLLNALSEAIPGEERLITIEDSAELRLLHNHWIRMETRPGSIEDTATEISQRDLVRNSLRMRPDRILIGEVRGAEVWDMLQAMNTGHEGSLTTIHANNARDALRRLEMMAALTGHELPVSVIREHVASAIRIVVHLARLQGGARRVVQISEISHNAQGEYILNDLFRYRQDGVNPEGESVGRFQATGHRPDCLERIASAGVTLDPAVFTRDDQLAGRV